MRFNASLQHKGDVWGASGDRLGGASPRTPIERRPPPGASAALGRRRTPPAGLGGNPDAASRLERTADGLLGRTH